MVYKLKCPKCGSENSVILELIHARLDYNVDIDKNTGELDYRNEEIYEFIEKFYCEACNFISKDPTDFIVNE